jgi:hypothetical protein
MEGQGQLAEVVKFLQPISSLRYLVYSTLYSLVHTSRTSSYGLRTACHLGRFMTVPLHTTDVAVVSQLASCALFCRPHSEIDRVHDGRG